MRSFDELTVRRVLGQDYLLNGLNVRRGQRVELQMQLRFAFRNNMGRQFTKASDFDGDGYSLNDLGLTLMGAEASAPSEMSSTVPRYLRLPTSSSPLRLTGVLLFSARRSPASDSRKVASRFARKLDSR